VFQQLLPGTEEGEQLKRCRPRTRWKDNWKKNSR